MLKMSKTYISKLQGELLDELIKQSNMNKEEIVEAKIKNSMPAGYKSLDLLSTEDVIKYLYVPSSYTDELPEHCKVGGKVRYRNLIYQVMWVDEDLGTMSVRCDKGTLHNIGCNVVKPVSSEEMIYAEEKDLFAKHGRDYWEIKEGDLLISREDKHSCDVKFVQEFDEYGCLMANGKQDEYITDLEELKNKYVVLVFVDDVVEDDFRKVRDKFDGLNE